jgi:hypothetical protein
MEQYMKTKTRLGTVVIMVTVVVSLVLSGCGKSKVEKQALDENMRQMQEEFQKTAQYANKTSEENAEQLKQIDLSKQKEEAENKARLQKEMEEKAKEQERAAAALKGFDTVILEPKVHFSKSLKDNSSYEFIGPKLADIKTLFAHKDWPGLIKLINGPDYSPQAGTVIVHSEEIKEAINRLRDRSFCFLFKTTYKLPPPQYDSHKNKLKCYQFFYVAIPLPTEKDEDLLAQDRPFEYNNGRKQFMEPGWELHPDGKGLMMNWSPKYSDIFVYVGYDDDFLNNPNSMTVRLNNLSSKYSEAFNKLNVRVREIGDMDNSQRNQKILEFRKQIKEELYNMLDTE